MNRFWLLSIEWRSSTSESLAVIFSFACTSRNKIASKIRMERLILIFIIYYKSKISVGKRHLWATKEVYVEFFTFCHHTSRFDKEYAFLPRNSFKESSLNRQYFKNNRSPRLVHYAHLLFSKTWSPDPSCWSKIDHRVFQNWVTV